MSNFLTQVVNALIIGCAYLLVAVGISIVYGLARYVNFAQGELVTLGAFASYVLYRQGLPLALAIVCSVVMVALASELLEFFLFRRTITRPFNGFVISLGLITALEGVYASFFHNAAYSLPRLSAPVWTVRGVIIDSNGMILVAVTVVVTLLLIAWLRWSRTGRYSRALAEDRVAVMVLGIPVSRVAATIFMVGSGLAALAGALLGTRLPFNAYSGSAFLLDGFAVAIVGGLGNIGGAVIAAVILSVADTFGSAYISLSWGPDFGLAALIVTILLFPNGILRGTESGEELGAAESAIAFSQTSAAVRGNIASRFGKRTGNTDPSTKDRRAAATKYGEMLSGRSSSWIIWIIAAAFSASVPLLGPSAQLLSELTYSGVIAFGAYSVWFLFRYAGIPSIAQAAAMGLGAYTSVICADRLGMGFWPQLGLAFVVGVVSTAIMGAIALRARGSYFLIVIFAFAGITVDAFTNLPSLTGGPNGIIETRVPRPLGSLVNLASADAYYWFVLVFLAVLMCALVVLAGSRFGKRLVDIRDNELLAQSLGLSPYRYKVAAFALCGGIAAVAGTLYLYQQLAVEPTAFGLYPGTTLILIVLLGGVGVLAGPVIGSVILTVLPSLLGFSPNVVEILDGLILVLVIVLLPFGVGGSVKVGIQKLMLRAGNDFEPEHLGVSPSEARVGSA